MLKKQYLHTGEIKRTERDVNFLVYPVPTCLIAHAALC